MTYTSSWILQRVTAFLLIPLTFWFIYQCIAFQKLNYSEIQFFFKSFVNCFLFLTMTLSMLVHSKIGCETIIQDYVSSEFLKKILKTSINVLTFFLIFLIVLSILKLNFF